MQRSKGDWASVYWVATNTVLTNNDALGPDGLKSAGTVTNMAGGGLHHLYRSIGPTTIGTAYQVTLIVKKAPAAPSPWMAIIYYSTGFGGADEKRYANVNLDSGEFSNTHGIAGRFIEDLGNGWWAVAVEHTAAISGPGRIYLYTLGDDIALNGTWGGSTAAHMHVWNIDVQAGVPGKMVPTSPVPAPLNANVTRAASLLSGSFTARAPKSITVRARTAKGVANGKHQFLAALVGSSGVPIEIYREPVDGRVIVSHGKSTYDQGIRPDHTDIDITVPLIDAPEVDTIHVGTNTLGANHWNGSIARIELSTVAEDFIPATLAISDLSAVKAEGDTGTNPFTFTVTRSGNTSCTCAVDWAVGLGTADLTDLGGILASGTVSFEASEMWNVITVDVTGDTTFEPDETFTVTLSNPTDQALITVATATGTIRNDEGEPATQFPSDLSSGHMWQSLKAWPFNGDNGDPPPAPWRTGPGSAGAHPQLGGHVWRDAVNNDAYAHLDGDGHMRINIDYNASHDVVETAYLITYPDDGSPPIATDYKLEPTKDGIFLEARVKFPNGPIPRHTWFAFWTYNEQDTSGDPKGEIDIVEYTPASAWSSDGFTANTHGGGNPTGPLHGNAQQDGTYGSGSFIFPEADWSGDQPADGEWHTYGLFWSTTEQRFYYDGHLYWMRADGPTVDIHQEGQDIRLTVEAGPAWNGDGTQAESYARGEFTEAHVLVDYVRVYERVPE